jgi:hypothetical protein
VSLVARLLGRDNLLPAAEVERLSALRAAAGYAPPVCAPDGAAAGSGSAGETVVLRRADLLRLVTDAVERFAR